MVGRSMCVSRGGMGRGWTNRDRGQATPSLTNSDPIPTSQRWGIRGRDPTQIRHAHPGTHTAHAPSWTSYLGLVIVIVAARGVRGSRWCAVGWLAVGCLLACSFNHVPAMMRRSSDALGLTPPERSKSRKPVCIDRSRSISKLVWMVEWCLETAPRVCVLCVNVARARISSAKKEKSVSRFTSRVVSRRGGARLEKMRESPASASHILPGLFPCRINYDVMARAARGIQPRDRARPSMHRGSSISYVLMAIRLGC